MIESHSPLMIHDHETIMLIMKVMSLMIKMILMQIIQAIQDKKELVPMSEFHLLRIMEEFLIF